MTAPYHLFQVFGVEVEYMIVDADTLRVRPITDELLARAAALPGAELADEEDTEHPGEVAVGAVSWSNELALHVFEMKLTDPSPTLDGIAERLQESVRRVNALLAPLGARLLPGAMHPWMDPDREMKLWPHGNTEIYSAFNRIFNCRGHGWANLQSMHLNLPFDGDEEFGRLHAAIRALLPIMPALSAGSPIMHEGGAPRLTGLLDNRLEVYRHNARAVPSVAGRVIPEPVYTRAAYEREILQRIYRDLEPYDPDGILRDEWANSRGCIARFSRGAIEIRVLDAQECPAADLAIAQIIVAVLRALCDGKLGRMDDLRALSIDALEPTLHACIRDAERGVIADPAHRNALGLGSTPGLTAGEAWQRLLDLAWPISDRPSGVREWFDRWRRDGCLARRILSRFTPGPSTLSENDLRPVCAELALGLDTGRCFSGASPSSHNRAAGLAGPRAAGS